MLLLTIFERNIILEIDLSNTNNLRLIDCLRIHVSLAYVSTGLTVDQYNSSSI